ncbi:MAG: beta-ketoacyl-[acyl-carrier-protein] synthase II, partial [Dehalococcoidia bacterium]
GAARAMRLALRDAGIEPSAIDYISAHATSTDVGDIAETQAIHTVFGERAAQVPVSAMKSQIGHLLGGSGGVETIACVQALRTGWVSPTLNVDHPGEHCDLDYVAHQARQVNPRTVLKNSFGFGGQNAVLVLQKYEG